MQARVFAALLLVPALAAAQPNTPSNDSQLGGWDNDARPTLRATTYNDPNGDLQTAAQFRIRRVSGTYADPDAQDSGDRGAVATWRVATALVHGELYAWQARYSDGQWSGWSAETQFRIDLVPPPTPTGPSISVTPNNGSFTFSWNPSVDALSPTVSYAVRYSPLGSGTNPTYTSVSTTSINLVFCPGDYLFSLQAVDRAGNDSGLSAQVAVRVDADPGVTIPAGAPTLSPNPSQGSMQAAWLAASGVSSYILYRETNNTGVFLRNGLHTGLFDGDSYSSSRLLRFRVCSVSATGTVSDYSATSVLGIVDTVNPTSPPSLGAGPNPSTTGSTVVSWPAGADTGGSSVVSYEVERAPFGTSTWTSLGSVAATGALELSDAPPEGRWAYRVRTVDGSGRRSPFQLSAEVLIDPTPANLLGPPDATPPVSQGPVSVTWRGATDPGSGVAGYTVQRSSDDGASWGDVVSLVDRALVDAAPEGRHRYRVVAANGAGLLSQTLASSPVLVDRTPPTVPAAPGTEDDVATGGLRVAWGASEDGEGAGVADYGIERTEDGWTWSEVARRSELEWVDPQGDAALGYRISARDLAGNDSAAIAVWPRGFSSYRVAFACAAAGTSPGSSWLAAALLLVVLARRRRLSPPL